MNRPSIIGVLLAAQVVAAPVLAAGPSILGTWCAEQGDPVSVMTDGLAYGDHQFCAWTDPVRGATAHAGQVSCRSDTTAGARAAPATYAFSAWLDGANALFVSFEAGANPVLLHRCED